MFARTDRLLLRPAWIEDAPALHAAISDPRVLTRLARVPMPYTLEDARAWCTRVPEPLLPALLVFRRTAGNPRLVGGCGLTAPAGGGDVPELGYWIACDAWGLGYATEAASAVVRMADAIGYRALHAHHQVDNHLSGRVLAKLGFARVGDVTLPSRALGRPVRAVAMARACGDGVKPPHAIPAGAMPVAA